MRTLLELLREFWAELRYQWQINFRLQDPKQAMEDELRLLHGRGLVGREEYLRLMTKLRKGQIGRGDLAILRKRPGSKQLSVESPLLQPSDPWLWRRKNQLLQSEVRLQDGREAVSQTLKEIEADLASTAQEAERIRERARAALPDESTAQLHLETRQRLLERTDTLERRLERAQQALQQVETLSEELQASQAEVRLLEVEERLAELDLEAQQTLLSRE